MDKAKKIGETKILNEDVEKRQKEEKTTKQKANTQKKV